MNYNNNDTSKLKNYQQPWLCCTASTTKKLGMASRWCFLVSSNLRAQVLSAHTSDLWHIHSSVTQATCVTPCLELKDVTLQLLPLTAVPSLPPVCQSTNICYSHGSWEKSPALSCPPPRSTWIHTSKHLLLEDFYLKMSKQRAYTFLAHRANTKSYTTKRCDIIQVRLWLLESCSWAIAQSHGCQQPICISCNQENLECHMCHLQELFKTGTVTFQH